MAVNTTPPRTSGSGTSESPFLYQGHCGVLHLWNRGFAGSEERSHASNLCTKEPLPLKGLAGGSGSHMASGDPLLERQELSQLPAPG